MENEKKRTYLRVGIEVHNSEGVLLKAMSMNFLSSGARAVIARTAWWAMHEGHEMVSFPLEPDEEFELFDMRDGGEA